jgi:hypothetical protein
MIGYVWVTCSPWDDQVPVVGERKLVLSFPVSAQNLHDPRLPEVAELCFY